MNSFVALLVLEMRQILRDPYTLGIAFFMPIVLVVLFAYGLNLDVDHIPTAVLDQDKSAQSIDYIGSFSRTGYFDIAALPADFDGAQTLLRRDKVKAIIVVPQDFSRAILGNRQATAQLIVDGSFPPTATVAIAYTQALASAYSMRTITGDAARSGTPVPLSVSVQSRVLYNPDLRTIDFLVPGLLGVILLAFPPLLSSLAVVRERERGSLMQLQIARVSPLGFVLAKLVPYVLIGFGELILLLLLGTGWFGVHFMGQLFDFCLVAALYVTAASGLGVLISTFTRSQVVAMLVSLVFTLMPSVLFSGFVYPIYNMPGVFQLYTHIFPARYFIEITRSMWLKGMPIDTTAASAAGLLVYTVVVVGIAVWRARALVKSRG
ncbi:MAG: ABC transporter permease [Candidatus Tyrphobacter sp.]